MLEPTNIIWHIKFVSIIVISHSSHAGPGSVWIDNSSWKKWYVSVWISIENIPVDNCLWFAKKMRKKSSQPQILYNINLLKLFTATNGNPVYLLPINTSKNVDRLYCEVYYHLQCMWTWEHECHQHSAFPLETILCQLDTKITTIE